MFLLSANHYFRPGLQPGVFKTEQVSRNKALSRNISAISANKSPHGEKFFFSFLKRHLPIDLRNLEIFFDKQGLSFQFPKTSRGGFSLLPGSLHLLIYFKILALVPKNAPEVYRIYGSYFGWRMKYSEPRKTNFSNEPIKA